MNPIVKILKDLFYFGFEKFGKYYSEYRGFVVDNADPEGCQRLRIVVPGIIDNPTDEWVFGTSQFSGKGYGAQCLPPKGDVIWVTFEHGDPNKPLWKHGYFGEGEIPKELRNPEIFWFKTPGGILVELDDSKKEVRITDSFKNQISMNKKSIDIKGSDNKLQPGTLGNIAEKILTGQGKGLLGALDNIKNVAKGVTDLTTKMAAAATPAGLILTLASEVPNLTKVVNGENNAIDATKKSITDGLKDVPKIKSKKVNINE